MDEPARDTPNFKAEAVVALAYFGVYLAYLFFSLENEAAHWLSLVLLPLGTLVFLHRRRGYPLRETLASVGLKKGNLSRGLLWAVILGLVLSALQLVASDRSAAILEIVSSGSIAYLLPLTFVFLLLTAGFTEEFFFRGVLQTRLGALTGSRVWAVFATSVLFGFYHLPYAYLNPNWPSYGDFGAALISALGQGIIGGLVLGFIYERTDRNLVASVLVHTLINLLPATTMIHIDGGKHLHDDAESWNCRSIQEKRSEFTCFLICLQLSVPLIS